MRRRGRPLPGGARVVLRSAALAAVAAVVTGCGSDDPAPSADRSDIETSLSREEFVDRADQICLFYETRIEAVGDDLIAEIPPSGEIPPALIRRFSRDVVIPNLEDTVSAIRDLVPPAGDEPQIERILSATERGIDQIRADPLAAAEADPQGLIQAGKLARTYGSQECGSSDRAAYLQRRRDG